MLNRNLPTALIIAGGMSVKNQIPIIKQLRGILFGVNLAALHMPTQVAVVWDYPIVKDQFTEYQGSIYTAAGWNIAPEFNVWPVAPYCKKGKYISLDTSLGCHSFNSSVGFAISIAIASGYKQVILFGCDMVSSNSGYWFDKASPNNPNYTAALLGLDLLAKKLTDENIPVNIYNASPISTVTQFPFVDIDSVKDILLKEK